MIANKSTVFAKLQQRAQEFPCDHWLAWWLSTVEEIAPWVAAEQLYKRAEAIEAELSEAADDPSDTKPDARPSSPERIAWYDRKRARETAFVATREGLARLTLHAIQVAGDTLPTALRLARRRRLHLAGLVGAPTHPDLLAAVATPDVAVPFITPAMVAVRKALAYHATTRRPFVCALSGAPGCGKSVAAVRGLVDWIEQDPSLGIRTTEQGDAAFVRASDVATTTPEWSEHRALWRRWETVRLLCVDDAGAEIGGNPERLFALLVSRWDAGRATFLTTNFVNVDKRDGERRFWTHYKLDARLADRLKEMPQDLGWWCSLPALSLRGEEQQEKTQQELRARATEALPSFRWHPARENALVLALRDMGDLTTLRDKEARDRLTSTIRYHREEQPQGTQFLSIAPGGYLSPDEAISKVRQARETQQKRETQQTAMQWCGGHAPTASKCARRAVHRW